MNKTPISPASKEAISAQIATFDFQINQVTKWFNAVSIDRSSLMLSGQNTFGKPFHELLVWDSKNPVPKTILKRFLQLYAEDMIRQRLNLITLLESGEIPFNSDTRLANCSGCFRPTHQRNYYIIPGSEGIAVPTVEGTWVCNECETIINS